MSATIAAEIETLDWWTSKWDELGLSTTDPGDDGSGIDEPAGDGYARLAVSGTDWTGAVGGAPSSTENVGDLEFATAEGGNWGTLTHACLFEGGVLKHVAELTVPVAVSDGDTLRFLAASIVVTLD